MSSGPGGYKGDFSDPPAWPGWSYRKQWTTAVRRWNKQTDVPLFRRAEKVLRTLGWELQVDFEHLTEDQLGSQYYLEYILQVIDMKAGVREDDERRQAYRSVMHDVGRRRDESLAQFAMRRQRDFTRAATFGVQLPNEFKAAMLREGAGLSEQGLQNLTALMQGRDHDIDLLSATLARLDTRGDKISGFVGLEEHSRPVYVANQEADTSDGQDSDIPEEVIEDETVLAELTGMDFTEEQAACIFAMVENRPPFRKRTWKENKRFKADIRKERGSFMKHGNNSGTSRSFSPGGRGRMTKEQLKKISKCNTCGKRGHWSEDCRMNSSTAAATTGSSAKVSAFCYLGDVRDPSAASSSNYTFAAWGDISASGHLEEHRACWAFLTIPPGLAILDTGATQDIIGHHALEALEVELEAKGLQPVVVPTPSAAPTGIGGQARVLKAVLIPIAFGGVPGVVKFVVIEGQVPPLLSVGLMAHLGVNLDLEHEEVHLKTINVTLPMTRLPSGHRAIPLVQWEGGDFEVPEAAKEQYDLAKDAFMKRSDSSAYTNRGLRELSLKSCASRTASSSAGHVKPVKHVRFGSAEYILPMSDVENSAEIHISHNGSTHASSVDANDLNGCACGRTAAQMGNSFEPPGSQFEFPRDRDHGSFVSIDERCGQRGLRVSEMEGADDAGVPHVGDHSRRLPPLGCGGDHTEEPFVGASQVLDCGRPRARTMPPSRSACEAGEPICVLDGVPSMLGKNLVHPEESTLQGQVTSSPERPRRDGTSISTSLKAISGDFILNTSAGRERAGDPGGAQRDSSGDDGRVQGDDRIHPRPCSRPRTDDLDDAEGHAGRPCQPDSGTSGRSGAGYGDPADAGGSRGGGRHADKLGTDRTRGKPERARPPGGWPSSLTWCLAATQLISWCQMTEAFQIQVQRMGGDDQCWVLYHDGNPTEADPSLPQWLHRPWIVRGQGLPEGNERVLWHSLRDEHGRILRQGPGPPVDSLVGATIWSCPRELALIQENMDDKFPMQGYDSQGNSSEEGPFWLLRAPGMQEWLESPGHGKMEEHVLREQDEAKRGLVKLATKQRGALDSEQVDFVEIFHNMQAIPAMRERRVRVPPPHEQFIAEAGWNVEVKEHRTRCRKCLEARRPIMVAAQLRSRACGEQRGEARAKQEVEAGFLFEVAERQISEHREIYIEAPEDHPLWKHSRLDRLLESCPLALGKESGTTWMTSSLDLAVIKNETADHSPPFEQAAKRLRDTREFSMASLSERDELAPFEQTAKRLLDTREFSMASCLKLLESVRWPSSSRRRKDGASDKVYVLLGQFTYGKFSGITKATKSLKWVTKYLNGFMAHHGALSPRSSLVVSNGNKLKYHKDVNNVGINHSIALGKFSGGGLWKEADDGTELRVLPSGVQVRGQVLAHRRKMLSFDPRRYHGIEPWEGKRWSITSFQTRSSMNLEEFRVQELKSYGFDLSGYPSERHLLSGTAMALAEASTLWATGTTIASSSFPTSAEDWDQVNPEDDDPAPEDGTTTTTERLSESQKSLIRKIHVNTGHPPRERLLRTLRAAGAKANVLQYVRDEFECETCAIKRGPDHRRKAQCPRTFAFNKVLSVDVFYVQFKDSNVAVLNMVCHGTGYHVTQRIEGTNGSPTAAATWKAFVSSWLRFLGPPQMMVTDGGNEFRSVFERGLEQCGILQHTTAPESPWQNSRAERHGGWLKQKLKQEIESGQLTLSSMEELDDFMAQLLAAKNRWFNSGGYTPVQLVFGEMPRVPGELLSEDPGGLVPLADAYRDPGGLDEAGAEFRRRNDIRERARQLALQATSKEAIQRAARSSMVPSRQWSPGQWVYCFRRGRAGDTLHPTPRWVGPGIVVLTTKSVVWVAMRTRLWRCSPEQLRPAFPSEVLGRELASDPALSELLRRVVSGGQTGAVDVTKEGAPSEMDHLRPIDRDGHGIPLSAQQSRHLDLQGSSPAPTSTTPIPPGLLPVPQAERPEEPRPHEPELREPVPSSRNSRRSSIQEPAQEPEVAETLGPIPEEEMHPDYRFRDDLQEQGVPGQLDPRQSKVPRTAESQSSPVDSRVHDGGVDQALGPAASSSSNPETDVQMRAPGTPIRNLLDAVSRGRQIDASERRAFSEEPPDDDLAQWFSIGEDGEFSYVASRSDEIRLKDLSIEEKKLFEQSDVIEWQAILKTKAVRVLRGKEAAEMRRRYPERVLSSRMVRRKKPQPGEGNWKAKSRWCIAGHEDPDTASLTTFSPTPATESIMSFLQVGLNLRHRFSFTDVRNAFCQSDKLKRPLGPIFAEPCEGLQLEPGSLIAIEAPVYGLNDAPAAWRNTVTKFLVEKGYVRNLVEPCWWSKYDEHGRNIAQVMIEVDDFILSYEPSLRESLQEEFQARFHFGKWEDDEAEYAGRLIQVEADRITLQQQKYITEQITAVPLAKGRRSQKDSPLTKEEFQNFRSAVYKVNWVAKETRPEVCGTASLMASRLVNATIDDVLVLNKNINHLRSTAARPLILWRHNPDHMAFLAISDAGGTGSKFETVDEEGLPSDNTQGAWMVLAANTLPVGNQRVRASPLSWRSSKLRRKVFSTFGGETQAMLQAINEVDWLQIMIRDATQHDVELKQWRNSLSPHMLIMRGDVQLQKQPQCSITDAKSLYDCIMKEHPQGKQDRKSALELAIIVKDLRDSSSMVRWVPHQKMLVDALTKADPMKANGAMEQFLRTGSLSLVDIAEELEHRSQDAKYRNRSHAASVARLVHEYQQAAETFWSTLIGGSCSDSTVVLDVLV